MKSRFVLPMSFGVLGSTLLLFAQQSTVDWFTIEGGGGFSVGDDYSIHGTFGQSDAGESTGGLYAIMGGFWSSSLGEVARAPVLSITLNGNTATLSWFPASEGFVLQSTPTLDPAFWRDAASADANPVTVSMDSIRFYRLRRR